MKKEFYKTINGSLVTNHDIARTALILTGEIIDPEDDDAIQEKLIRYKGITGKVENSSLEYLINHGKKVEAIRQYYEAHKEVGFARAKQVIDHIEMEMMCK